MFGGTIHILPKYSLVNQLILVLNSNDNAASCNAVCIVVANILGLTQKNEPQGQFMNCPYGKMRLSGLFCCVSPIYIAFLSWLSTEKPLFPKLGIFAVVVSQNWRVSLMHQGVHHHLLSYFAIIATIQAIWLALIVMVRFV
jgi:hypothetical protein